jgi:predicted ester cyclase
MSTTVNKEIVRRFYEEVFNQRNVDAFAERSLWEIDELVHPQFLNHDPTPVASRDPESMKQFIHTITQAFPDHHHAIFQRKGFANEDLIAEGDKVVMRCTLTATHQGLFPGFLDMPPTGKSICQRQIHILRVRDGKVAEHRVVRDDLTIMQQLGLIPQPEMAA